MKWCRFLAMVGMLACVGCGHLVDVKASLDAFHEARPCCANFQDLTYTKLAYPSEVEFAIRDESPVFEFGADGKSRFAAFELPESDEAYRLVVRSYVLQQGLLSWAVFFPLVTFLDADKRPIYTSDTLHLQFIGRRISDEPFASGRLQFSRVIIPPNPERLETPPRYIVIHSSRELIELGGFAAAIGPVRVAASSIPSYAPIFIPIPKPDGPPGAVHRDGSPVGVLKLRLEAVRLPGS